MKFVVVAALSVVTMGFLVVPSHAICWDARHHPIDCRALPHHSKAWLASQYAQGRPCMRYGNCQLAPVHHPFLRHR